MRMHDRCFYLRPFTGTSVYHLSFFFLINRHSKQIKPEQVSLQAAAELTFKGKVSNEKNQDKCNTFAWLFLSLACVSFN